MIVGPDIDTPESRCPHCKHKLDGAFSVNSEEKKISPGDVSLCGRCGEWALFGPDLKLVKPSAEILARIKRDRTCQIAYHTTMKLIRQRTKRN